TDPNLPAGFAPFGIQAVNGKLYVTYAQQDDMAHDENHGPGLGLIDVYDTSGHFLQRLVTGGVLNAPWGLALAPANFGTFSNDLLVGNFGDGRVNAFDPTTGAYRGTMTDANGQQLRIDGLWGLAFGNGVAAGDKNVLFFTAGPGDESHGEFGSLAATTLSPPAPIDAVGAGAGGGPQVNVFDA